MRWDEPYDNIPYDDYSQSEHVDIVHVPVDGIESLTVSDKGIIDFVGDHSWASEALAAFEEYSEMFDSPYELQNDDLIYDAVLEMVETYVPYSEGKYKVTFSGTLVFSIEYSVFENMGNGRTSYQMSDIIWIRNQSSFETIDVEPTRSF